MNESDKIEVDSKLICNIGGVQRLRWTNADKQQLRELYRTNMSTRDIAHTMGRTVKSIKSKMSNMGLGTTRFD